MRISIKLKAKRSYLGGSLQALDSYRDAVAQSCTRLWAFHFYPCRWVLLLTMLMATVSIQAQVISLDSVLDIIDKQSPMLQGYNSKVNALNTYAGGAKSWMAPMVGVGTFMTPYPNQTVMDDRNKGSVMFSIEQSIPNPAKLNANRNYLSSRAAVEVENRSVRFNQLRSEAKGFYYKWLVAEQRNKVLHENEQIIELMLKLARLRYPYNQGSLGNIYKAEARLHEVNNMIQMNTSDIEAYSFRLKTLMNIPIDAVIMVDTTIQVKYDPNQFLYDTATVSTQRSDVRQIDKTIEVMQLNQQLQRSQAKPDFKIRFDHMQPIGNMPSQFTAMAMMSIPIAPWTSKMYKSEVKGMQYDIEAMQQERKAILIETQGMVAGMVAQLKRMQQQLENYRTKIIPALKKNYQTLMLAYEENREQLPLVIDAWEARNMAQMEYLQKVEEYYNMIVNYEKQLEK